MNKGTSIDFKNPTLQYYEDNPNLFIKGTVTADMENARARFLRLLPSSARILDFGCGSGRDAKAFMENGYAVDAIDGSAALCRKASELLGTPVRQMLFQDLDAINTYDGIWACASILHVPKSELADILHKIAAALTPNGILYTSFKYGTFEGMRNGRYFTDFTEESLKDFWTRIPSLRIIDLWITQDVRPERKEERWINLLAARS